MTHCENGTTGQVPTVTVVERTDTPTQPDRSDLAVSLMRRLGIPGEPGPNPLGPIQGNPQPSGNS